MKEFTFNCPTCGQPILASKDWEGRQMNCPSCNTRMTIPSAAKASKNKRTRITAIAASGPKPRKRAKRLPGFP
jgi:DNA-directed RNA polymerase subunit RPC12/RpoP